MAVTDEPQPPAEAEQRKKEAYFTASQSQLIWARFRKNRTAMIAGIVLLCMVLMGVFAPFLSPYDPTIKGRDADYTNGAPQIPQFCDDQGCSSRPFIYGVKRERSIATNFRWVTTIDTEDRRYVQFFVRGDDYRLFGISGNMHLFGVDKGYIHLFGTDDTGKDIFSRTLHAIYTSLAVGTLGVLISFVLALVIGGVAGYFGGYIDGFVQMVTDAVRTIPIIPLFMALAALHSRHDGLSRKRGSSSSRSSSVSSTGRPWRAASAPTCWSSARRNTCWPRSFAAPAPATSSAATCCPVSPAISSSIW